MSSEAVEYVRGIPVVKTFGQLRWPMTLYTLAVNSVFVF